MAGIKRAQALVEATQNSVGLKAIEVARPEIWVLVNDYIVKTEQLKRVDEYWEEKVKEVPNVEKLLVIKGVGLSTIAGFIAEVVISEVLPARSRYRNLSDWKS